MCRTITLLVALAVTACRSNIDINKANPRNLEQATQDCQEFIDGRLLDANVVPHGTVRIFALASSDYRDLTIDSRTKVKAACAKIALDLGADNTWSNVTDDEDASLSNAEGTGACDVASARIGAIMDTSTTASFAFIQVPGACYPEFMAQARCDSQCMFNGQCDSGSIEGRCDPAQLSVVCSAECSAGASCEGSTVRAATCNGSCEATCVGHCSGTCTKRDGTATDDDPNCDGKCNATCEGTCSGRCTLDHDVQCGASVSCKGGCASEYTAPRCETTLTPPNCQVDANCLVSCSASAAAQAPCDPPHTELFANTLLSADVAKLVVTLNANLGDIDALADAQGVLLTSNASALRAAGEGVLQGIADLDPKSTACATVAAQAAVDAEAGLQATVKAARLVRDTCRDKAL